MSNLPVWLTPATRKRRQNARSAAQERSRAAETGGTVQAGSGSSWRQPQDVKTDQRLEQLKYTDADSFPLRPEEFRKIFRDALNAGREPALIIEFTRHDLRLVITEG